MSKIRDVFLKVLNDYPKASSEPISSHPLADFIRFRFRDILEPLLPSNDRYLVRGSPGKGNWGKVPWVATFDTLITSTAQSGYYITYLFKADMSGIFVNLNQGVTDIQKRYKAKARDVLEIRAKDYKAQLGPLVNAVQTGPIELGVGLPPNVELYNHGSICSKFYSRENFPSDEEIIQDYKAMLNFYSFLVDNDNSSASEDESTELVSSDVFFEDTRKKKKHERIERNQSLSKKVKSIHGYTCQACGFNFEDFYGPSGKGFIEAHHLIPISSIINQQVSLDPKSDFAVLCANCHRMIHKLNTPNNLELLKNEIQASRRTKINE